MVLAADTPARAMMLRMVLVVVLGSGMLVGTLLALQSGLPSADAQALRISSSATCAQLSRLDPSVTNGSNWGKTVLPGHGAAGGWFGVDVCSNNVNFVSPNGSNVSCSHVAHGCDPTTDGYGWTFQCPELIVRFSAWAFGDNPGDWGRSGFGNAPDLWLPINHPSDFVMYKNGSSTPPVPGDILIWGSLDGSGNPWPSGPDGQHGGHIAVVAAVHGNKVITAEQNVKWGSQDHPSDVLALTKAGSRWILSGSARPTTTLPTWRWQSTMGRSRGTFGWLHSVKNNGHFPSTQKGNSNTAKKTPGATSAISQQFPGGLPSLSASTVVTQSGTLADLTWSTQSFFSPSADVSDPQAQVRNLGIPPGNVRLASGQIAATLTLSNGSRYTYVLGVDGMLYSARTSPDALGVFWTVLNHPSGVTLAGSPVASLFAGGVAVAARGSDGNLWWLAGPADRPGNWVSLGAPAASPLSDGLALAGAPGAGSPVVFAIGTDGRLYTRIWQEAMTTADGTQLPAKWSDWFALGAQPISSHLTGSLLIVPELPAAHNWIGPWPDSPIDLFASDTAGTLWWYRSTRLTGAWGAASVVGNPAPLTGLLGGIAVAAPTSATRASAPPGLIELYATARDASYLATMKLPGAGAASASKPTWAALASSPVGTSTSSAAVALGPGNSALVTTSGDDVLVGGAQSMTEALAPVAAAHLTAGKAINPWMRVGAVPAQATFSDTFTTAHLDSRWTRSDSSARASATKTGLTLAPGTHNTAALTQAAYAGDVSLSVQIAHPASLPDKGNVGLVLYADDGDWLTLTVDRSRTVSLCATVSQESQPCQTVKAGAVSSLWLRVTRSGSVFTASFSGDGTLWRQVGIWTPAAANGTASATAHAATPAATATATAHAGSATPTPTSAVSATDPAAAPLAFTSWGVLARGNGHAAGWPALSNFTVTPA